MKLSQKTRRAIARYGKAKCISCYHSHQCGNGANTVGIEHGLTTNQSDAAINAGRELCTG